jgi:hypothetical protein
MVARSVTRQEVTKTIAASQSLKDEALKLVEKGAWDPSGVREWQQVADTARKTGEKAHVGRIFGIVVEKHPELPHGHPERRFKGRLVFQGNEKADGEQAYIQAPLGGISGGVKTWARLPRDMWPDSFKGLRDPVVPVHKSIYGHPQSGGHWEEYCEAALHKAGWFNVPEWPSVYWYPKLRLLLMVYVDDFKMADLAGNLVAGWKTITDGIKLVGIGPVSTYLGCEHATLEGAVDNKPVRGIHYNMQPFMESCVDAYRKIVGKSDLHLPRVDTLFLADDGGGHAPTSREDEGKHFPTEKCGAGCIITNAAPSSPPWVYRGAPTRRVSSRIA